MKTYLINHLRIPGDVPILDGLASLDKIEATVAPFGGKWPAQGSGDVLEGAWPGSVVLIESPSRKAATDWYASPAYQTILPLRTRNAISDLILIDQLPESFSVKEFAAGIRQATQAS